MTLEGPLGVCRELGACGGCGGALTRHALVLKVDPTENSRFHVRGQRVPPFVFESHDRLRPSWAVATIWGDHKIQAFSKEAAATLTGAAVTQTSATVTGSKTRVVLGTAVQLRPANQKHPGSALNKLGPQTWTLPSRVPALLLANLLFPFKT